MRKIDFEFEVSSKDVAGMPPEKAYLLGAEYGMIAALCSIGVGFSANFGVENHNRVRALLSQSDSEWVLSSNDNNSRIEFGEALCDADN